MAKEIDTRKRRPRFADAFYVSREWRKCRAGYIAKVIFCERCAKKGLTVPGEHVHHIVRLTPDNITNPEIALSYDNLELLCERCHKEEHGAHRYRADASGHIDLPPV